MRLPVPQTQRGFTLVELMVSLTVSLILVAGILQIYTSNQQTYRVQEALSRVQESGRFGTNFLSKDIRMVGFLGCVGLTSGLTINNNVKWSSHNYGSGVEAELSSFSGTDTLKGYSIGTTLPADLTAAGLSMGSAEGNVLPNTDAVIIRRGGSCPGANVVEHNNVNNSTANIKIADNSQCQIAQNDIVMVTDCIKADIFGVTDNVITTAGTTATVTHGGNNNTSPKLAGTYSTDAQLFKMVDNIYYIGVGESGEPSLFKRGIGLGGAANTDFGNAEIVEGVEGMSLLYGEDISSPADHVADTYVTAGSVTDFNNVVSIRVKLTVRSAEDNVAVSVSSAGDRRLRRDFTTTTTIRNRAP